MTNINKFSEITNKELELKIQDLQNQIKNKKDFVNLELNNLEKLLKQLKTYMLELENRNNNET